MNPIAVLAVAAGLVAGVAAARRWLSRRGRAAPHGPPPSPAPTPAPPAPAPAPPAPAPETPIEAPPPAPGAETPIEAPAPVDQPQPLAASWVLVPCLVQLRTEINQLCPDRDHASDGTIGDAAHQGSVSDHNDDEVGRVPTRDADRKHEVHAVDIDDDLREPGITMQDIVDVVVGRHRRGADNRLTYVIYNRRIWSATRGWTARAYDGPSPHTEHAHFSASYVTAREADTRPFGILEELMALDSSDVDRIWDEDIDRSSGGSYTARGALLDTTRRTSSLANSQVPALAAQVRQLSTELAEVRTTLAAVLAAVQTPPPAS